MGDPVDRAMHPTSKAVATWNSPPRSPPDRAARGDPICQHIPLNNLFPLIDRDRRRCDRRRRVYHARSRACAQGRGTRLGHLACDTRWPPIGAICRPLHPTSSTACRFHGCKAPSPRWRPGAASGFTSVTTPMHYRTRSGPLTARCWERALPRRPRAGQTRSYRPDRC